MTDYGKEYIKQVNKQAECLKQERERLAGMQHLLQVMQETVIKEKQVLSNNLQKASNFTWHAFIVEVIKLLCLELDITYIKDELKEDNILNILFDVESTVMQLTLQAEFENNNCIIYYIKEDKKEVFTELTHDILTIV